jgi:hypothetical protein
MLPTSPARKETGHYLMAGFSLVCRLREMFPWITFSFGGQKRLDGDERFSGVPQPILTQPRRARSIPSRVFDWVFDCWVQAD